MPSIIRDYRHHLVFVIIQGHDRASNNQDVSNHTKKMIDRSLWIL
jgi:hypothetical protein